MSKPGAVSGCEFPSTSSIASRIFDSVARFTKSIPAVEPRRRGARREHDEDADDDEDEGP